MSVDNEQLMDKLVELHGEFREFRGEMKARVDNIEKDADDARKWENYKIYAILPITVGLHAIATKLGLIKR